MTQSAASIVGVTTKYSTLCGPLNRLLDGGLKQGCILELSGAPGCGKEALAVNISRSYVDSSKGVLFIDMQNMTTPATLDRLLRKSSHTVSAYQKLVRHLQLHTLLDLMVFLQNLPSYLQNHPDIALIVLNSLSFPFQSPDVTYAVRNAVLDKVKQILAKTVASTRVTVVITSQLATKMYKADGSAANFDTGSRAIMVPLLGNAHLPSGKTYRVLVIPQSRISGVLRLLSSPTHIQGRRPEREESYQLVGGEVQ